MGVGFDLGDEPPGGFNKKSAAIIDSTKQELKSGRVFEVFCEPE